MSVRTRFAPSPTGFLHLGSARTALFNFLYARHHGGVFVLRIEDTDRERSTQHAVEAILDGLKWLGLNWDEGPIFQMQRLDRYQQIAEQWLREGHAYACDCSLERLEAMREAQIERKEKPRYDGHCRERALSFEAGRVLRFKTEREGRTSFEDLVHGLIEVDHHELDDLVLLRSDGIPTYNFAVVVDDLDGQITHIIRGDDHINNTPRQLQLYRALGATTPKFAHIPMILGEDGKRLSKRHGAVSIQSYREAGYLPEAMNAALLRMGWSCGDREEFSLDEAIELFNLESVQRSAASFNVEKLRWLNQQSMKAAPPARLGALLSEAYQRLNIVAGDQEKIQSIAALFSARVHTLQEMAQSSAFIFQETVDYNEEAWHQHVVGARAILEALCEQLKALDVWTSEHLQRLFKAFCAEKNIKFPQLAQPLRVVLTGNTHSPSIDAIAALIGQTTCLQRIQKALERI